MPINSSPIATPQAPIGQPRTIEITQKTNYTPKPHDPTAKITPPPSGLNKETKAPVTEGAKPAEATKQPLSPQHSALARKEAELRKARQELKAEQDAWQQSKGNYVPKEKLTSDTLKTLAEAGISYDRLVELQLDKVPQTETQILQDKIAALEAKLNGVDDAFKTRDQQAYDQAVNVIRNDAKLLVESDPAYETIKATGKTEDVVGLIEAVFKEEGNILSVEEAAKEIEEALIELKSNEFVKLSQLSRIKARLAPKAPEAKAEQAPASKRSPTLTNNMSVNRPLTPRERAILAFKGELK